VTQNTSQPEPVVPDPRGPREVPQRSEDASWGEGAGPVAPGGVTGAGSIVTEKDLAVLAEQLGREPRGVVGIAARCVCGRPTVVRTAPRLPDGTPFPTTFYLTHPGAVAAASTLEANGVMKEMTERLAADSELAAAYLVAHEHYLAQREALGHVEEIAGISAGGMPTRVKCLHVLMAHALAFPGVNPLGDEALALVRDQWRPDRCSC
jgi:hypothetical protein